MSFASDFETCKLISSTFNCHLYRRYIEDSIIQYFDLNANQIQIRCIFSALYPSVKVDICNLAISF